MIDIASWYTVTLLFGIAGAVPSAALFPRLPLVAIACARPIGLLLVALFAWLASALTPIPYGSALVAAGLVALLTWSACFTLIRPRGRRLILGQWRTAIVGEALFVVVFVVILLTRMLTPAAITFEKPMELMLLTVISQANSMPPPDAWLAGSDISYYHLGFVMYDILQRFAGQPPSYTLALGFASAIATAAVGIAALGYEILLRLESVSTRAARIGVAVVVANTWFAAPAIWILHLVAGGLSYRDWFSSIYQTVPPLTTDIYRWWWLESARILPESIAESPPFILIHGDLHSHVVALPLMLTGFAIAVDVLLAKRHRTWRHWRREPVAFVLTSALFAGLAMTHMWDAITCGCLWLAAGTLRNHTAGATLPRSVASAGLRILPVCLAALVMAWPMLVTFEAPRPFPLVATLAISSPFDLLGYYGAMFLPLGLAVGLRKPRVARRDFVMVAAIALFPVGISLITPWIAGTNEIYASWGLGVLTPPILALISAFFGAAAMRAARANNRADTAWLAMAAAGFAMLLLSEAYELSGGPAYWRANTIFKFGFPAWILIAVAAGIAITQSLTSIARSRHQFRTSGIPFPRVAVAACMSGACLWLIAAMYVPAAIAERSREHQPSGLDSLAYVAFAEPDYAAAITWVSANLDPDRHILIEMTEEYSHPFVLSTATGVPSLVAWPSHQRQWRAEHVADLRLSVVETIYRQGGDAVAIRAAAMFGVTHVYIGPRERAQYGGAVDEGFSGWTVVFAQGASRIVALPAPPISR